MGTRGSTITYTHGNDWVGDLGQDFALVSRMNLGLVGATWDEEATWD
jgi:hypothetical protein